MQIIHDYDHEVSLVSAVSWLALTGYASYIIGCFTYDMLGMKSSKEDTKQPSKTYSFINVCLLLFALEVPYLLFDNTDGLADLIQGKDPRLNEILEQVPLLRQGPSAPFLLRNRHIQFIPWLIQNEIHRQEGLPFERQHVDVTDCLNKVEDCDLRSPRSKQMNDTITMDIFPPFQEDSPYSTGFNSSSPVIFFSPGLRCYSQDMPGNMIIRKAYARGFRSIVVHRRGHTPNQPLQSPRWNLFGDVDDMEQVYWFVKDHLVTQDTAMFFHGISSGTALTVTALAKWDRRRRDEPDRRTPAFVSSVAVTPGYDISKVMNRERFLFPYNDILLGGVKDHFVVQNEAVLRELNSEAVDQALAARSLQEFVDASVPFAGYESTSLYYRDTNPINDLRDVSTPKLVLNSIDDPCCNINNLYEASPYPQHEGKTYDEMIRETQHGLVAVSKTGSHCPFLCTRNKWLPFVRDPFNGGWMLNSWADEVSIEYYEATLRIYSERRFL